MLSSATEEAVMFVVDQPTGEKTAVENTSAIGLTFENSRLEGYASSEWEALQQSKVLQLAQQSCLHQVKTCSIADATDGHLSRM